MRRLDGPPAAAITLDLEGEAVEAREGEPIAAALLANGTRIFSRSVKYHRPRAPYCFASACSNCLMRVDGVPNVYTCRVPARAGMRIERQNAYPSAKFDVFESIDWFFPGGLDHHEMFAGVPVAHAVMEKVARQLAGLGLFPDVPALEHGSAEVSFSPVAIIGGGVAGGAAARVLTEQKVPFVLLEAEATLGGRTGVAPSLPDESIRLSSAAIGIYEDEGSPFAAVITRDGIRARLWKLHADRFLVCNGTRPRLIPFGNNDLPGVIAASAAVQLVRTHRILPGNDIVVLGAGRELLPTAETLREAGARIVAVIDTDSASTGATHGQPISAHGLSRVSRLSVKLATGATQKFRCDAIVVAAEPTPAFELARQGGAFVRFDEKARTFIVDASRDGETSSPSVFVAGDLTGYDSIENAAASGVRAAEAIARAVQGAK